MRVLSVAATIGVAKKDNRVSIDLLDHCLREDLNKRASRFMGVLNPLKVVIENYPENQEEELEAINNPEDPGMGTRMLPFSREIFIEREDFMEDPPRKFFRLGPGREVRVPGYIRSLEVSHHLRIIFSILEPVSGQVFLTIFQASSRESLRYASGSSTVIRVFPMPFILSSCCFSNSL